MSLQNVFTRSLESGDRQKAMKRLRVPPLGEKVGTINQSCIFRVVQVIKSLQDPLEVGNNLPWISDNSNSSNLFCRIRQMVLQTV